MGLEPTTFSLATRRSTTELCPLVPYVLKLVAFSKLKQETKWLFLILSNAKFIYIIFLLMYLTTMEFIKTETPIQICDIGASPIDKTDFIEELLINSNSKLIGFEPNSVEFEKLNQNDPKRKYYDFGIEMEQKKH